MIITVKAPLLGDRNLEIRSIGDAKYVWETLELRRLILIASISLCSMLSSNKNLVTTEENSMYE